MNEVYFKNSQFGDLKIEYVIVEHLYPILFVLIDACENRYLCVCCEIRDEQRWIVTPISNDDLIDVLSNNLYLHDAFVKRCVEAIVVVRDYKSCAESFFGFSDDNLLDLPTQREYLDAEEDEHAKYVRTLRKEQASNGLSNAFSDQLSINVSYSISASRAEWRNVLHRTTSYHEQIFEDFIRSMNCEPAYKQPRSMSVAHDAAMQVCA